MDSRSSSGDGGAARWAERPKSVHRRRALGPGIDLSAARDKLLRLLLHPLLQRLLLGQPLFGGEFSDVFRDLHRAEMRAAHAAEMGALGSFLWQGLVMKLPGRQRIQAQVELILPAEFESRLAQGVVPVLGPGMSLGQVRGVGG